MQRPIAQLPARLNARPNWTQLELIPGLGSTRPPFDRWWRRYSSVKAMMAVSVELEPSFQPSVPRALFEGDYKEQFDVFPNGDFAMITLPAVALRELEVVVNWSTELAGLVPAGGEQ